MPKIVEETRCRLSPGTHGFSRVAVYCHAHDNVIYRIDATGKVNVFGRLPDTQISDAALAFDTFGAFGFRPRGRTREIATCPTGRNPIVAVPARTGHGQLAARRVLYVTDTNSTNVFFAPAASLARYTGDLIVGSELKAIFWAVSPRGGAFQTRQVPMTPPGKNFNLEGATFVDG